MYVKINVVFKNIEMPCSKSFLDYNVHLYLLIRFEHTVFNFLHVEKRVFISMKEEKDLQSTL